MILKDKLFIGIIAVLLLVIFFYKGTSNTQFPLIDENNKLKQTVVIQLKTIDSLTAAQIEGIKQIDSLKTARAIIKLKYRTLYEAYKTKDSLVNSLSIDSIIQLWTKRYSLSETK